MSFDQLRKTSSTVPSSSTYIAIATWVDQLPVPAQQQTSRISTNPQHLPRARDKGSNLQPATRRFLKRRAISHVPCRRSARLASLQRKRKTIYPNEQSSEPLSSEACSDPILETNEVDLNQGHSMTTRGRFTPGLLNLNSIPSLMPATPSHSKSGSPGKSRSKSPRKSRQTRPAKSSTIISTATTITKRDQLAQMEPRIRFLTLDYTETDGPTATLWINYIAPAINQTRVVPQEYKAQLEVNLNTPRKTSIPVHDFQYGVNLRNSATVLSTVENVVEQAREHRGHCHESHWISSVVEPLIINGLVDDKMVETLNISTVSIWPHDLCPTSPSNVFTDADKKIDFAIALRIPLEEQECFEKVHAKYRVQGPASLNQTEDWTSLRPMFANLVVETDGRDPLIQLGVWIAAEFEKRNFEGHPMDIPVPAIAIYGDQWYFWIARSRGLSAKERAPKGKNYRVDLLGPMPMGNTFGAAGVFQILHVLEAVVRWGLDVYKPDYYEKVLAKYKE